MTYSAGALAGDAPRRWSELIAGPLAERFGGGGARRALAADTLGVTVSALGMGLATSLLPLLLAGLLGAVGRAAILTAQAVVGAQMEGDDRRRVVSWIMTGHSSSA